MKTSVVLPAGWNRWLILPALALAGAAGPAAGQSEPPPILSTVAGFETVEVTAGQLLLARVNLIPFPGWTNAPDALIGDQLPPESTLFTWDETNRLYCGATNGPSGWPAGGPVIRLGESFWLRASTNESSTARYAVAWSGRVPDASDPLLTRSGSTGLNFLGFAYPKVVVWSNTVQASQAANGSKMHLWRFVGPNWGYVTHSRTLLNKWMPSSVLRAGEGYIYAPASTQVWTEAKPYSWP